MCLLQSLRSPIVVIYFPTYIAPSVFWFLRTIGCWVLSPGVPTFTFIIPFRVDFRSFGYLSCCNDRTFADALRSFLITYLHTLQRMVANATLVNFTLPQEFIYLPTMIFNKLFSFHRWYICTHKLVIQIHECQFLQCTKSIFRRIHIAQIYEPCI